MKHLIVAIVIVIFTCIGSLAQTFNLAKYTNVSGLPQNYVYSIVQDNNGFVWIGMAEGLSKYDGLKFINYTTRDSLSDNFVSKLLIDIDGDLWCGHGNGQFSAYKNGHFQKIYVEEVNAPIKDMCLDDKGNIWAVEQNNGIIKIDPDHNVRTFFDREKFGRRIYYSIKAINSMTLLVGTSDGTMIVKFDVDGELKEPEEVYDLPSSTTNCIVSTQEKNVFLIGTDEGEIYRYSIENGAQKLERNLESCSADEIAYDIRSIHEAGNGDIYIGTWGNGLKEWKYMPDDKEYVEILSLNEKNGLDNNFVSSIMFDREGIFWFGTYGGGVVAWVNNYFAQYDLAEIGFHRHKVTSAAVDDKNVWIGMNMGLIRMDKQCVENYEYFDTSMGLPSGTSITSICFDPKRDVQYIGTDMAGIYIKRGQEHKFYRLQYAEESRTSEMVNSMVISDDKLYIASQGGFIIYDIETETSYCYTTIDGLPHNNINFVYADPEGQIWFGPKDSGITTITEDGSFETHRLSDVPVNVAGMVVDDRERMWLATVSNGVLCTSNDSIVSISTADGLEKNYCYGISMDGNKRIWVYHQPGLSCIDLNTGNIRAFNNTNGLGLEFNGVSKAKNGDLWFSSTTSVVHYITRYDKRSGVAPIINLTKVSISGRKHNIDEEIDLAYPYDGNVAKFEFDFVGICMKDPQKVRYEYWLQMNSNDNERWMPLGTQNHKEFDFLPDGDYVLYVRAFNSDGVVCDKPLAIKIHIDAPFWKSIFFPLFMLFIIFVIVRVITKWREKKLRQRQKELEAEVDRQTITLREQKSEIERKNKDVMDSINYAKRIQTAILPSIDSLQDFPFRDSFILFMPRDIVSGDFYWFNQYDNKVLLCCGDCTGHGVPGAFMTMIGVSLLNDSTHSEEERHPSNLLNQLDKGIKSTLNKNQSIETQDGMDCAIFEFDLDTLRLRSAAARRPIYIFSRGRLTEIKGTRRGVGEHRNSNEFTETVIQLRKGDTLYLSSDGFVSQFDGSTEAKPPYTAGRLKRFLETIVNEPMEEQKKRLTEEFMRWKGDWEQIDDVIIIGIKI